jgi:polyisoprenoid-binding protein YceI
MKSFLFTAIATAMMSASSFAATDKYQFDTAHTRIFFKLDHAGFSDFIGQFKKYEGDIQLDLEKPDASSIVIRVMPEGIDTELPDFDKKLQGKEFFNSSEFPVATFKSTKVTLTGKDTADVLGDFTLLGVTKPLTLRVTHNKNGYDKWNKSYKAGFSATASFKRSEWGMNTYVPVVGDEVTLMIESEVTRPLRDGESY